MATSEMASEIANGKSSGRRTCILILGMHRSGTSALARVISLLGASLPNHVLGGGPGNEKGHWEPERLNPVHEDMLVEAGTWHLDWRRFDPASLGMARQRYYRDKIRNIISEEYRGANPIVLKEPRICRFVDFYLAILEDLGFDTAIVHITRSPLEVSASLATRNGTPKGIGNLIWLRHVLDAEFATRGRRRVFVSYPSLLEDWRKVAGRISDSLGLQLKAQGSAAEEIDSFLDRGQRHHQDNQADLGKETDLPPWLGRAMSAFSRLESKGEDRESLDELDAIRREFETAATFVGDPVLRDAERRGMDLKRQLEETGVRLEAVKKDTEAIVSSIAEKLAASEARLIAARRRPWEPFSDFVAYHILRAASRLSPPFTQRQAERYARSATKRDPDRNI